LHAGFSIAWPWPTHSWRQNQSCVLHISLKLDRTINSCSHLLTFISTWSFLHKPNLFEMWLYWITTVAIHIPSFLQEVSSTNQICLKCVCRGNFM
jgi:hypothetical protein